MKICPECQANNRNEKQFCVDCGKYIGNVACVSDKPYLKTVIKNEEKRLSKRRLLLFAIFLSFTVLYLIFFSYLCYISFGNLDRLMILYPLYLLCFILFLLPYDRFYEKIRKKMKLSPKRMGEFATITIKVILFLFFFILFIETYNRINVNTNFFI